MKKDSTKKKNRAGEVSEPKLLALLAAPQKKEAMAEPLTIGLDLGDRGSWYGVLDDQGEVIGRDQVVTERQPREVVFGKFPPRRVALEVGPHWPWVSRVLPALGQEVLVANARRVKRISESSRKNDRWDAEFLARLARAEESFWRRCGIAARQRRWIGWGCGCARSGGSCGRRRSTRRAGW